MKHPVLSDSILYARMLARLRLRHLRLLVALDEGLALSAAAAQVGISQPAATQMLKELESLLEIRLYERQGRGLRPTPAAQILAGQAKLALGNLQQAADALAHDTRGLVTLRVGAITAAVSALIAPHLGRLRTALPQVRLQIIEDTPEHVMTQLTAGLIQLALVREPAHPVAAHLQFTVLQEDRIAIVASRKHPMARRRRVCLADLQAYPWSMPMPTHPAGIAFEAACNAAGFSPRPSDVQSISQGLLRQLLEDDLTLVAAPRSILTELLGRAAVREIPMPSPMPIPPLGALYSEAGVSRAALSLIALLNEMSSQD